MIAAVFETSDPSCLKEYGIVQYIRGRNYDITRNKTILSEAAYTPKQAFITDLPTGGAFRPNHAGRLEFISNSTLEFSICVYRTHDIPTSGDPAPITASLDRGGPLHCFSWDARAVWDFETKQFKDPGGIDPFCATIPAE